MAAQMLEEPRGDSALGHVAVLFGGRRVLRHRVSTQFDAHEMILHGMPGEALMHLVGHPQTL